jgi:DUF971 family protein
MVGLAALDPPYTLDDEARPLCHFPKMTAQNSTPTAMSLAGPDKLLVDWSDGTRRAYNVNDLRRNCPCATCNTQRMRAPAGEDPLRSLPPVAIEAMSPVGNYAYKIVFSDQHSTGIYPLELLQVLGNEEPS